MIAKELIQAYKATCYSILNPKIDIYLEKENEALQSFLKEESFDSWCFITAWNPFSKALSAEENKTLNKKLETDLINYAVLPAAGNDTLGKWSPEISFFVGNISKEQAFFLGKKYEQNAIVYGEVEKMPELLILV